MIHSQMHEKDPIGCGRCLCADFCLDDSSVSRSPRPTCVFPVTQFTLLSNSGKRALVSLQVRISQIAF